MKSNPNLSLSSSSFSQPETPKTVLPQLLTAQKQVKPVQEFHYCSIINKRQFQEDGYQDFEINRVYFSVVFDAHGGNGKLTKYCLQHYQVLLERNMNDESFESLQNTFEENLRLSLTNSLQQLHELVCKLFPEEGLTCCVLARLPAKFVTATVGDCVAQIGYPGGYRRTSIRKLKKTENTQLIDGVLRIKGILNTAHVLGDAYLGEYLSHDVVVEEFPTQNAQYVAMFTDGVDNCFAEGELDKAIKEQRKRYERKETEDLQVNVFERYGQKRMEFENVQAYKSVDKQIAQKIT